MDFEDIEEVGTADHNDQVLFKKCYVKVNEFLKKPKNNPWNVPDPSSFLRYHCPECPIIFKKLGQFSAHAKEKHPHSRCLFNGMYKQILVQNLFSFMHIISVFQLFVYLSLNSRIKIKCSG